MYCVMQYCETFQSCSYALFEYKSVCELMHTHVYVYVLTHWDHVKENYY